MHLPQSHHHPDPLRTLAPHLLPHLPYSLPILRIIQHTPFNPDARIFSTFISDDNAHPQRLWAAVYVERSRFPDTECWLFSTFETWVTRRREDSHQTSDQDGTGRREGEARMHMLSVLNDVAAHSASLQPGSLPATNTPLILGTLNETLLPLLAGSDFPTLKPVELLSREVVHVVVDGGPAQDGTLLPLAPSRSRSRSPSSSTTTISTSTISTSTTKPTDAITDGPSSSIRNGGVILAYCNPIHKFLIPPRPPSSPPPPPLPPAPSADSPSPSLSLLPDGYSFTGLLHHAHELPLAVSRSAVPRTVAGLGKLGAVGVRVAPTSHPTPTPTPASAAPEPEPSIDDDDDDSEKGGGGGGGGKGRGGGKGGEEGELISWLFLSPDGSFQSLHVEPEHRGKGVAKAVCRRLMDRLREEPEAVGMRRLPQVGSNGHGMMGKDSGEDDGIAAAMREVSAEGWAHSDVLEHNKDGAGVARGIGGKAGWRVRWVGVDLERVKRVCGTISA